MSRASTDSRIPVNGSSLRDHDALADDARRQPRIARYQRRLRALALELSLTAERERRRIATGLHDDVGQNLAVARLKLESLRRELPSGGNTSAIDEIVEVLDATIESTRSLTFELCPPVLYELGLAAALQRLAYRLRDHFHIACRIECDDGTPSVPTDTAVVVHQVVRELLHNVVKHARAKHVGITMVRPRGRLEVEVADDGVGFTTTHASVPFESDTGFGLFSARERLLEIGGRLTIQSMPDQGTRAVVTLPLVCSKPGVA